jgi:hypothetical protein
MAFAFAGVYLQRQLMKSRSSSSFDADLQRKGATPALEKSRSTPKHAFVELHTRAIPIIASIIGQ